MTKKHSHYFKPTNGVEYVDVYWILQKFEVIDPTLQHAIKKLLCAGIRGGGKDFEKDVQEAIDTLERGQELRGLKKLEDPKQGVEMVQELTSRTSQEGEKPRQDEPTDDYNRRWKEWSEKNPPISTPAPGLPVYPPTKPLWPLAPTYPTEPTVWLNSTRADPIVGTAWSDRNPV